MPDTRERAARYLAIVRDALEAGGWTQDEAEQLAALQVFAGVGKMDAGFRVAAGERLPELIAEARRALAEANPGATPAT
jgi:hypothetical protein